MYDADSYYDNEGTTAGTESSAGHRTPIHGSRGSSFCQSGERWPESITARLTNNQSIESRVKMFKHFAAMFRKSSDDFRPLTKNLKLISGAFTIARPGKATGGEDAFFCSDGFVGVADGVGEWGEYDCCPRQFAEELMKGSQKCAKSLAYHKGGLEEEKLELGSRRALRVLKAGYHRAIKVEGCFGSSTSLVAGLDYDGSSLGIACLGDSTCMVLRRCPRFFRHMTIAKRTKEQQHFFNCPYQLSRVPGKEDIPALEAKGLYSLMRVVGSVNPSILTDSPDMANLYDLRVHEGDLIILGTDGLFDNLFDSEIIYLASLGLSPFESKMMMVQKTSSNADGTHLNETEAAFTKAWAEGSVSHPLALEPPAQLGRNGTGSDSGGISTPPELIARGLAEAAFYRALDPKAKTPFAKQARSAGCHMFSSGGKMDDITVVACWVVA